MVGSKPQMKHLATIALDFPQNRVGQAHLLTTTLPCYQPLQVTKKSRKNQHLKESTHFYLLQLQRSSGTALLCEATGFAIGSALQLSKMATKRGVVFSFWPSVKKRSQGRKQRRPAHHHATMRRGHRHSLSRLHHTRCEELKDIRTLSASSSFSSWPLFRGLFGFFPLAACLRAIQELPLTASKQGATKPELCFTISTGLIFLRQ